MSGNKKSEKTNIIGYYVIEKNKCNLYALITDIAHLFGVRIDQLLCKSKKLSLKK